MEFLPVTKAELKNRGIDAPDFIMVSGDAYVDHVSFGHALIARLFESQGFSVAVTAQPVRDADFLALGAPNVAFLVSGGAVDSMVANYTASKKKRSTDDYSPGGGASRRPDRAVTVYCRTLKRLFPDVPVIIGGLEASLRRLAHYDYWSDTVMPSVLYAGGADLLVYGMGEKPVLDLCAAVKKGIPVAQARHIRGTAYCAAEAQLSKKLKASLASGGGDAVRLCAFKEVAADKKAYAEAFALQSAHLEGAENTTLVQEQEDGVFVVVNPPQRALTTAEHDAVFALPYARRWHPMYDAAGGVPALEEVRFSVIGHRGCYGGCSFCAIGFHQGRRIQARSEASVLAEAETLTKLDGFKGYIHDVGGPTANFSAAACAPQQTKGLCTARDCIGYASCPQLTVSHREYLSLLRKIRALPGVKKVFIRSGVRFDYLMADKDDAFFKELCLHHISGQLKVAPEHVSDNVLRLMNKPPHKVYEAFYERFYLVNKQLKKEQFLVPYFISSLPGSTLKEALELALYLKKIRYNPQQVQDFYPTPSTRATCMYHTGIDPRTGETVYTARTAGEKAMQRALLQYRRPENRERVAEALRKIGRADLIGYGADCLIPPPRFDGSTPRFPRKR